MFKVGDKVVCINTKFNGKWGKVELLKSHKIYTINYINDLHIGLKEDILLFDKNRFISLIEFRKQKIKKICSKLEMK